VNAEVWQEMTVLHDVTGMLAKLAQISLHVIDEYLTRYQLCPAQKFMFKLKSIHSDRNDVPVRNKIVLLKFILSASNIFKSNFKKLLAQA